MKITNKKLLLGLGMASLSIAPFAMVVSCADSSPKPQNPDPSNPDPSNPDQTKPNTPPPGVSQEKWNQYVELFGVPINSGMGVEPKAITTYKQSLANSKDSSPKTKEEVLELANTKLKSMTEKQLEDAFFSSLNLLLQTESSSPKAIVRILKDAEGGSGILQESMSGHVKQLQNIDVTSWNNDTNEISFKITSQLFSISTIKYDFDGTKYNKTIQNRMERVESVEYHNFVLKPTAVELDSSTISTGFELSANAKSQISNLNIESLHLPPHYNEYNIFMLENNDTLNQEEKERQLAQWRDADEQSDKDIPEMLNDFKTKLDASKIGRNEGKGDIVVTTSNNSSSNDSFKWIQSFLTESQYVIVENGLIHQNETNDFVYKALSFAKPFIFASISEEANTDATITFHMYEQKNN